MRVSTTEQDHELQRTAIERAAAARGDTELAWFSETRSGASWVRPELEKLISGAARGLYARIYVFKLDRLTRRGSTDTLVTVQRLREGGAELISLTEGIQFGGLFAEPLIALLGFSASLEREAMLDRQRAARAAIEARGGKWGRPAKIPPEKAAQICQLRQAGRSIRSIAMAVKIPRATVHDILTAARLS